MKLGFAFCGSFCNHRAVLEQYEALSKTCDLIPILSERAAAFDTRFGTARELIERVESLAGRRAIRTIVEAEPLGPSNAMDALVIAPCTGNTLAKLATGMTDGTVPMAAKSHLRNGKPVIVAPATNDGLSAAAPNIAALLNRRHYYFVPFGQDDPEKKPNSLVADFTQLEATVRAACEGRQIQPILL